MGASASVALLSRLGVLFMRDPLRSVGLCMACMSRNDGNTDYSQGIVSHIVSSLSYRDPTLPPHFDLTLPISSKGHMRASSHCAIKWPSLTQTHPPSSLRSLGVRKVARKLAWTHAYMSGPAQQPPTHCPTFFAYHVHDAWRGQFLNKNPMHPCMHGL